MPVAANAPVVYCKSCAGGSESVEPNESVFPAEYSGTVPGDAKHRNAYQKWIENY